MSIPTSAGVGLQLVDDAVHPKSISVGSSAKRRKKQVKTLGTKEWEPHKARIIELHISEKRPLNEVKKIMEHETGFKAESRQYRRRISQWGLDKNVKPKEMKAIVRKRQQRMLLEPEKAALTFKVRGHLVNAAKIIRWMKRNDVPESIVFPSSPAASTPSDLECRTLSTCTTPRADALDEVLYCTRHSTWIGALPTLEFLKTSEQSFFPFDYPLKSIGSFLSMKLSDTIERNFLQGKYDASDLVGPSQMQAPRIRDICHAYIPEKSLSHYSANEGTVMLTTFFYMVANGYLDDGTEDLNDCAENLDELTRHAQMDPRIFQDILKRKSVLTESITESLFRLSIVNNNVSLLQCLLEAGISPNDQTCSYKYWNLWQTELWTFLGSVFEIACYQGSLSIVQKLVEAGKTTQMDRTVRVQLLSLRLDLLLYLKDQGFDLSVSPTSGEPSLLMRAALAKDFEICRFLIDLGADVRYTDSDGASAILFACSLASGYSAIVSGYSTDDRDISSMLCRLLVAKGADVTQETWYNDGIVRVNGPFKLFCDSFSKSPIEEALRCKNPALIRTLFELGASMTPAAWTRLFYVYRDSDFSNHIPWIVREAIKRSDPEDVLKNDLSCHDIRNSPEDIIKCLLGTTRISCLRVGLAAAMKALDFKAVLIFLKNGAEPIHEVAVGFVTQLNWSAYRESVYSALRLALVGDIDRALHIACGSDNVAWVKALLGQGANPDAMFLGTTALAQAILDPQIRHQYSTYAYDSTSRPECLKRHIVRALLDAGADINRRASGYCRNYHEGHSKCRRASHRSVLHEAVMLGKEDLISFVLDLGANPSDGTALCAAIRFQPPEILRLLLDSGADVNIVDDDCGHPPLTCAIISLQQPSVKIDLLLRAGVDPNAVAKPSLGYFTDPQQTPLQAAAGIGDLALTKRLLDLGADVNAPAYPERGATALQLAAIKGFTGIAAVLLDKGADVNAPAAENDGRSALEGAAEWGRIDMICLLVQNGACIDSPGDGQYERALELAKMQGRNAAIRLLEKLHEDKKADAEMRDFVHDDLFY